MTSSTGQPGEQNPWFPGMCFPISFVFVEHHLTNGAKMFIKSHFLSHLKFQEMFFPKNSFNLNPVISGVFLEDSNEELPTLSQILGF